MGFGHQLSWLNHFKCWKISIICGISLKYLVLFRLSTVNARCFLSQYYQYYCAELANADGSMSCDDCKNCAIMGPSTDVCDDGSSSGGENPGFHRAVCPLQTPVLWNIRFECGAVSFFAVQFVIKWAFGIYCI